MYESYLLCFDAQCDHTRAMPQMDALLAEQMPKMQVMTSKMEP